MTKTNARAKRTRCAIYTRKSSDEGLDQEFNSLHAQREACEAFIASQRHEGWHALTARKYLLRSWDCLAAAQPQTEPRR